MSSKPAATIDRRRSGMEELGGGGPLGKGNLVPFNGRRVEEKER